MQNDPPKATNILDISKLISNLISRSVWYNGLNSSFSSTPTYFCSNIWPVNEFGCVRNQIIETEFCCWNFNTRNAIVYKQNPIFLIPFMFLDMLLQYYSNLIEKIFLKICSSNMIAFSIFLLIIIINIEFPVISV